MTTPVLERPAPPPAVETELDRTWAIPRGGIVAWLSVTDHKAIGLRFIVTALGFFVLGGIEALMLRAQLARPQAGLLTPEMYSEIFTMHGTTMMFFFAVPMWEGFALYLVPLLIGTRETPFPRMNAFAYYIYLLAGLGLYAAFLSGAGPDSGWFAYPTLSRRVYSPSIGMDVWALSITLLEFSALAVAVTLIVTLLKHRAPGMALQRMPMFAWAMLVFAFMVVFAMPSLVLATMLLELDRAAGTHFFNPSEGGDPVLWQHLFWWFGHPEVYIMFLPGLGVVAALLPSFTRRELFAYPAVVFSFIATALISFGVWAHHMFAVGMPRLGLGFFAAATSAVAIPAGVAIFAWLATVVGSHCLVWRSPFLFAIGFVLTLVFGGISGVALASVPFDWQAHDTHFVVGHFHYVLVGGMVFPMLAGLHFWYPKVTGRLLNEAWARWTFALTFVGLNVAFFPMHLAGLRGMVRRVYTYPMGLGLEVPNAVSTVGAFLFAAGILLLVVNLVRSRRGERAGNNPWAAETLEWTTSSPPPPYNFAVIPSVASRSPGWTQPEFGASEPGHARPMFQEPRIVVELREDRRETPITSPDRAEVQGRNVVSGPSLLPFAAAVAAAIGLLGAVFSVWFIPLGAAAGFVSIAAWHWPERRGGRFPIPGGVPRAESPDPGRPTQVLAHHDTDDSHNGAQAPLWWGMALFITIEAVFFLALLVSYYYLHGMELDWPPGKHTRPKLHLPIAYTLVLIASSVFMHFGDKSIRRDDRSALVRYQTVALLLAVVFLTLKGIEYTAVVDYKWHADAYSSLTWTMSGFHAVHVFSVLLKGVVVLALARRGYFRHDRRLGVAINGVYWHFVVAIWIPLFFTLYIFPWVD